MEPSCSHHLNIIGKSLSFNILFGGRPFSLVHSTLLSLCVEGAVPWEKGHALRYMGRKHSYTPYTLSVCIHTLCVVSACGSMCLCASKGVSFKPFFRELFSNPNRALHVFLLFCFSFQEAFGQLVLLGCRRHRLCTCSLSTSSSPTAL